MDASVTLYGATRHDHPCFDRNCEIAMALEARLGYTAAHLLREQAIPAPYVARIVNNLGADAFSAGVADEAASWQLWLEANAARCDECGALARRADAACGRCRAKVA